MKTKKNKRKIRKTRGYIGQNRRKHIKTRGNTEKHGKTLKNGKTQKNARKQRKT